MNFNSLNTEGNQSFKKSSEKDENLQTNKSGCYVNSMPLQSILQHRIIDNVEMTKSVTCVGGTIDFSQQRTNQNQVSPSRSPQLSYKNKKEKKDQDNEDYEQFQISIVDLFEKDAYQEKDDNIYGCSSGQKEKSKINTKTAKALQKVTLLQPQDKKQEETEQNQSNLLSDFEDQDKDTVKYTELNGKKENQKSDCEASFKDDELNISSSDTDMDLYYEKTNSVQNQKLKDKGKHCFGQKQMQKQESVCSTNFKESISEQATTFKIPSNYQKKQNNHLHRSKNFQTSRAPQLSLDKKPKQRKHDNRILTNKEEKHRNCLCAQYDQIENSPEYVHRQYSKLSLLTFKNIEQKAMQIMNLSNFAMLREYTDEILKEKQQLEKELEFIQKQRQAYRKKIMQYAEYSKITYNALNKMTQKVEFLLSLHLQRSQSPICTQKNSRISFHSQMAPAKAFIQEDMTPCHYFMTEKPNLKFGHSLQQMQVNRVIEQELYMGNKSKLEDWVKFVFLLRKKLSNGQNSRSCNDNLASNFEETFFQSTEIAKSQQLKSWIDDINFQTAKLAKFNLIRSNQSNQYIYQQKLKVSSFFQSSSFPEGKSQEPISFKEFIDDIISPAELYKNLSVFPKDQKDGRGLQNIAVPPEIIANDLFNYLQSITQIIIEIFYVKKKTVKKGNGQQSKSKQLQTQWLYFQQKIKSILKYFDKKKIILSVSQLKLLNRSATTVMKKQNIR